MEDYEGLAKFLLRHAADADAKDKELEDEQLEDG